MKILVNVPDFRHIHGGVTNHYIGLRPHWKEDVRYNIIGKRREGWSGLWWLPYDYLKFIFLLLFWRPDLVLVNPSMNRKAWPRDSVFIRIALFLGKKVSVMFHGWTSSYFNSPAQKRIVPVLNRCAGIFVLAGEFRDELRAAGVTAPVKLTSTKVSDDLLEGGASEMCSGDISRILFLARVVEAKGIYVALDLFKLIAGKFPRISFTIAGDGEDLDNARKYAADHDIPRVTFTGHVSSADVARLMRAHQVYVLPTTHAEGMPTSVLEAMAFGMVVVTRPVGGLKDFFEHGRMGILTDSLAADDYFSLMEPLLADPALVRDISQYNAGYARRRFMASAVAADMENTLSNLFANEDSN